MAARGSLSATNLAVHQHFNCDLYLYNTYHGPANPHTTSFSSSSTGTGSSSPSELTKAQYKRGLDWETRLYTWLSDTGLLLQVPSLHLDPDTLLENIFADDRSHFFITGLTFWPPQGQLNERFRQEGTTPLNFGLAKPDLLEIMRTDAGIMWRVLDVKASKHVKTSHHMQIYFYTLCLRYLFKSPFYHAADSTGIWLPAKEDAEPSLDDIKSISLELLTQPFDNILFRELPRMLSLPRRQIKWHYNPLCNGCPFESECRTNAQDEGRFGAMANISINDVIVLKDLLRISRGGSFRELPITDIEELHELVQDRDKMEDIAQTSPSVVKKARQILGLPKKTRTSSAVPIRSPLVEAARTKEIQVINRKNYTCPRREDIAIFVSVVVDPSTSDTGGNTFCITSHSQNPSIRLPLPIVCRAKDFIPRLATLIRTVTTSHPSNHRGYTTQFYVWSAAEHQALQSHIIAAALTSTHAIDDIQLCVGALSQGAALLQTAFQPLLLSGALLSFLGKGQRRKAEYVACLKRMGLPTEGTVDVLRKRIDAHVRRVQEDATAAAMKTSGEGEGEGEGERRRLFGQLPRVVVLKKEIERQLALPVPGYWDLPECVSEMLSDAYWECPTDEQIFVASRAVPDGDRVLKSLFTRRNKLMYAVLRDFRTRAVSATGHSLLINEGTILSTNFMDLCRQPHIRKLFFMQQFEVLAKLTEAWQSRIEGCPDAPTLQYIRTASGATGQKHVFRLLSGAVDVPPADRDYAFFDKLLVRDTIDVPGNDDDCDRLSAEALFDDLSVSGLLFPLNNWTKPYWTKQDPRVQREVMLADVRTVYTDQERLHTMVSLRTWGSGNVPLQIGATYRLSPRLVDFNTTKILSALFEIDLTWGSLDEDSDDTYPDYHYDVPFLQLIMDPSSLGKLDAAEVLVKKEADIQRLFRNLKGLGNDTAGSLILKPSQHRAAQRILSNRLSVVWGPPGTGKTYTVSLSLLRLLEVERRQFGPRRKIIMVTAVTHAAVDACRSKLRKLMEAYKSIESLPTEWVQDISLEHVERGSEHAGPKKTGNTMYIYAGTIYQLSNFMKRYSMEVDCVVIDEAGQISLGSIALVLRSLTKDGRIIIAGDSEQLAPILSAQYPQLKDYSLFGSVLDCLMFSQSKSKAEHTWPSSQISDNDGEPMSQGTVIQLTENFRLNPDLGEFVSTIYSRQFKPQKVQARELALALRTVLAQDDERPGINTMILTAVQTFLVSLSDVMFKQPQTVLVSPEISSSVPAELLVGINAASLTHRPVSLAMIRLKTSSAFTQQIPYETHVHGEAAVAAALVDCIQLCCPYDDIFVATPHRIQREAVRSALAKIESRRESPELDEQLGRLTLGPADTDKKPKVTVDTVERLQGSEASFVICLFSLPKTYTSDLPFLLERRRLNVAISRAKNLCILITSDEVLRPGVRLFADEETAKGYAFLKAFEKRAWSYNLPVNMDTLS